MSTQQSFELRTWGGRRRGAGRKPRDGKRSLSHAAREVVRAYQPVHLTVRMAPHVWNLRSERSYRVFHRAVRGAQRRGEFRVAHFSVQGNHLHLIVEAGGNADVERGMRSLAIRLALGLNGLMDRSGRVLEDRYHMHVLRTPAEVRNALRYVVGNFASHAARRGERIGERWRDRFSSAAVKTPREPQLTLWAEPVTAEPETWLLRTGARDGRDRTSPRGGTPESRDGAPRHRCR